MHHTRELMCSRTASPEIFLTCNTSLTSICPSSPTPARRPSPPPRHQVRKKNSGHPHTNMAKAALNMLTCTSAIGLAQEHILINAVDTGWVTDMAPGGVGVLAATHETRVAPPLDEVDGAARVLDPVFMHLADHQWRVRGKLWKDYHVANW